MSAVTLFKGWRYSNDNNNNTKIEREDGKNSAWCRNHACSANHIKEF